MRFIIVALEPELDMLAEKMFTVWQASQLRLKGTSHATD